jgi:hypothetical protein
MITGFANPPSSSWRIEARRSPEAVEASTPQAAPSTEVAVKRQYVEPAETPTAERFST